MWRGPEPVITPDDVPLRMFSIPEACRPAQVSQLKAGHKSFCMCLPGRVSVTGTEGQGCCEHIVNPESTSQNGRQAKDCRLW